MINNDIQIKKATVPNSFAGLINPLPMEEFLNNFWETQVLHIQRQDKSYYESIFSIDDVDAVLDYCRPTGRSIRVVKNQEPLDKSKYEKEDGSLHLNQLYAAYANGHTIVVNEIERFWHPIKRLCNSITNQLHFYTVANMYLTPKHQKALLPHYDTHDVLVVQIHGSKTWRIYDDNYRTPLIGSYQPVFKREQLHNMREVTLKKGDLMYVPRGVPHDANTNDESSLHLTLGIYPHQWMDYVIAAIRHRANFELRLRKALPAQFFTDGSNVHETAIELLEDVIEKMKLDGDEGTFNQLAQELRNKQSSVPDGHFNNLDNLGNIGLDTMLKVRFGLRPTVTTDPVFSRIAFAGNTIKGPAKIQTALEFFAAKRDTFSTSDIPLEKELHKIKLAQRLVRGGLLTIAK